MHAGVQGWAEQAASHVEKVATFRAGGLPTSVRTIAHCGFTGTVAYSLIGKQLFHRLGYEASLHCKLGIAYSCF